MTAEPTSQDVQAVRLGVLSAVIDGDSGTAYRMVLDLLGAGVPFEVILTDILAPLQREVGERWGSGDFRIADEHASTGAVETLVALLAGSFDRPEEAPLLLAACAEGDNHSLPARMAAAYLTYQGWQVTFIGASLPAIDLERYVADVEPDVVLISCSMAPWLIGARACVRAVHAGGIPVLVGGRAFGDDDSIARSIGADGWAPDLAAADRLLREWEPDPATAEANAAEPGDSVAWLLASHPAVVAGGLRDVREELAELGWPLESVPDHANEFGLLVTTLASALLVATPELLTEFATDQAAWLSEHGAPAEIGDVFVRALEAVIGDRVPEALPYLEETRGALRAME